MKITLLFAVFLAVTSCGTAFMFNQLTAEECQEPEQVNTPICNLIPPPCLRAVCAEDTSAYGGTNTENLVWFKSLCHLVSYNIRCRGRYRMISESTCPDYSAPMTAPGVCPLQIPNLIPNFS